MKQVVPRISNQRAGPVLSKDEISKSRKFYDKLMTSGAIPPVDQIGWPQGVQPNQYGKLIRMAMEVVDAASVCEAIRLSGVGYLEWRHNGANDQLYKPKQLLRHLESLAVCDGDNGAWLAILMLAHLHRQMMPILTRDMHVRNAGIKDGKALDRQNRLINAATRLAVLKASKMGKTRARKIVMDELGMTLKEVRNAESPR